MIGEIETTFTSATPPTDPADIPAWAAARNKSLPGDSQIWPAEVAALVAQASIAQAKASAAVAVDPRWTALLAAGAYEEPSNAAIRAAGPIRLPSDPEFGTQAGQIVPPMFILWKNDPAGPGVTMYRMQNGIMDDGTHFPGGRAQAEQVAAKDPTGMESVAIGLWLAGVGMAAGQLSGLWGTDAGAGADIFGEGTAGATVDYSSSAISFPVSDIHPALDAPSLTPNAGATTVDTSWLDTYYSDYSDPFATTADVNAGWNFETGYGLDYYNVDQIGQAGAAAGNSLSGIFDNITNTIRSGAAAVGSVRAALNSGTKPPPNYGRAVGSANLGMVALVGLGAFMVLR